MPSNWWSTLVKYSGEVGNNKWATQQSTINCSALLAQSFPLFNQSVPELCISFPATYSNSSIVMCQTGQIKINPNFKLMKTRFVFSFSQFWSLVSIIATLELWSKVTVSGRLFNEWSPPCSYNYLAESQLWIESRCSVCIAHSAIKHHLAHHL